MHSFKTSLCLNCFKQLGIFSKLSFLFQTHFWTCCMAQNSGRSPLATSLHWESQLFLSVLQHYVCPHRRPFPSHHKAAYFHWWSSGQHFTNLRQPLPPESPLFSRSLAPSESSVTQYKGPVDPATNSSTHTLYLCGSASWPEQSLFRTYWQKQHWPLNCSHVLLLIIY